VRLENGKLDAVLDDGVLVINELIFAGHHALRLATCAHSKALTRIGRSSAGRGRVALRSLTAVSA